MAEAEGNVKIKRAAVPIREPMDCKLEMMTTGYRLVKEARARGATQEECNDIARRIREGELSDERVVLDTDTQYTKIIF
jgi:hypothetical protein